MPGFRPSHTKKKSSLIPTSAFSAPGADPARPGEAKGIASSSGGDDQGGEAAAAEALQNSEVSFKIHSRALPEKGSRLFQNLLDFAEKSGDVLKKILEKMRGKAPRSFKGSPHRKTVNSTDFGRNTHLAPYNPGTGKIALLQSILNAVKNGHFNPVSGHGNISRRDLLSWKRTTKESFNLILLADSSKSTSQFLGKFSDILNRLTGYFRKNKDRMGLILIQGKQAGILNNPSANYRVVTRSLLQIDIGGETPLASGLSRGLEMAAVEKLKNPGSRSLIILISDCAPEPLTGDYSDILEEPAYQDSIKAAKVIGARKIPMVIINPSFMSKDEHYPHERLSNILAVKSGARLVKLRAGRDSRQPISEMDVSRIFGEIESAYRF